MCGVAPVQQGFGAPPGWHPQYQYAASQPMTLPPITEQPSASQPMTLPPITEQPSARQPQPEMQFVSTQEITVRVATLSVLLYRPTNWKIFKYSLHDFRETILR